MVTEIQFYGHKLIYLTLARRRQAINFWFCVRNFQSRDFLSYKLLRCRHGWLVGMLNRHLWFSCRSAPLRRPVLVLPTRLLCAGSSPLLRWCWCLYCNLLHHGAPTAYMKSSSVIMKVGSKDNYVTHNPLLVQYWSQASSKVLGVVYPCSCVPNQWCVLYDMTCFHWCGKQWLDWRAYRYQWWELKGTK